MIIGVINKQSVKSQNNMLEIVKTADGSNTIYNAEVGENYHSKHGALQESRHVFVNSGLRYFLDRKQAVQAPYKSPPPVGGETFSFPVVFFKSSLPGRMSEGFAV